MQTQQLGGISEDHLNGIVEQVEAHVQSRLGGRVSDLRVLVRDAGLILQGRCRAHHAKQLALQAAMEITEQPILAHELRVSRSRGDGARHREESASNFLVPVKGALP